jgi:amidohydrolase
MKPAFVADVDALIEANLPRWVALRHQLHAYPELRFEEHNTAEIVARELAALGYNVSPGIGGTGVVASLEGFDRSRAIMFRADLDALPIQEAGKHSYASCIPGKMHACGHDGHTVMLLAAARVLKELPKLEGSVHFVFQPGEEGGAGAQRMLDDGLLEQFPCEAVFGLHNWPSMPEGHFGLRVGPIMAAGTRFRITVTGRGAHAAQPHEGLDPIPVACSIVLQCNTLCARHINPVDPAVISVCMVHAGDADNVIPAQAELRGTIRTLSTVLLKKLQADIARLCDGIACSYGADIDVEFFQFYPATVNSPSETALCEDVLRATFGDAYVHADSPPNMTSEDFGFMLQARPGAYVLAGSGEGAGTSPGLHNPHYDFNDAVIPKGVHYWVALARRYFERNPSIKLDEA